MPALESAAKNVANDITHPRPDSQVEMEDIQVMLNLNDRPQSIRKIKVNYEKDRTKLNLGLGREFQSSEVSQLVKISGIIVAASQVRSRATRVTLQCRTCHHTISNQEIRPGLEYFQLPRKCMA